MTPKETFLGGPDFYRLDHACIIIHEAFGVPCYLVGSSTKTRDYRDVDVRLIMEDKAFEGLFGTLPPRSSPLVALVGVAMSAHLENVTGLPVDFQIQKRSRVSQEDWEKSRVTLGFCVTTQDSDGNWLGPPWIKHDSPE